MSGLTRNAKRKSRGGFFSIPEIGSLPFGSYAWAAVILILAVLVLLFSSSCGGGATVTIRNLQFDPDTVTIKAGQSVTWKNEDRRSHHVMSGAPPEMTEDFVSPVLETGDSWSHTFEQPGEFPFHDMVVPGLLGRVIVEQQ